MAAKRNTPVPASLLPTEIVQGVQLLLRAHAYARDLGCEPWDFAVPADELRSVGTTPTDIRWMHSKGLVDCGKEVTIPGEGKRVFRQLPGMAVDAGLCVVLTNTGAEALRQIVQQSEHPIGSAATRTPTLPALPETKPADVPHWDAERRELSFRGKLVKRYRVPAKNQELILAAFEEEGWPCRIDDPLSFDPRHDAKERLQTTIKSLNRNQVHALLWFHGNGHGAEVLWERRGKG